MSPNPAKAAEVAAVAVAAVAATAIPELSKSDLGRCFYSTSEAWGLSADARRGPCTARPCRRTPGPASRPSTSLGRRDSPETPGSGAPRIPRGSAQPAAPARFPPRRPGRTAPGYLRAAGGDWRLRSLLARGWLRRSNPGSSTHSDPRGPGSGGSPRARKRLNSRAFSSSDATTEARTRNRARAAAQVLRGRGPRVGVGGRGARAARLLPAARLWRQGSLSACVFSLTAGASRFSCLGFFFLTGRF